MNLNVALRHALSRLTPSQQQDRSLEVTLVATVEIQGEGERRRRIGPVTMAQDVAAGFISAATTGDGQIAAQRFEEAFALSYGVTDIAISDVSQLEIGAVSS